MPNFLIKLALSFSKGFIQKALAENKGAIILFVSGKLETELKNLDIPLIDGQQEANIKAATSALALALVTAAIEYLEINGNNLVDNLLK